MLYVNQFDGFDCFGCVWGDLEYGLFFEFCENGVKVVVWEVMCKCIMFDFFVDYIVFELCGWLDYDLEYQGCLIYLLCYDLVQDRYLFVVWDDVFVQIGVVLWVLESFDQVEFYILGWVSNEVVFLYQLFV